MTSTSCPDTSGQAKRPPAYADGLLSLCRYYSSLGECNLRRAAANSQRRSGKCEAKDHHAPSPQLGNGCNRGEGELAAIRTGATRVPVHSKRVQLTRYDVDIVGKCNLKQSLSATRDCGLDIVDKDGRQIEIGGVLEERRAGADRATAQAVLVNDKEEIVGEVSETNPGVADTRSHRTRGDIAGDLETRVAGLKIHSVCGRSESYHRGSAEQGSQ